MKKGCWIALAVAAVLLLLLGVAAWGVWHLLGGGYGVNRGLGDVCVSFEAPSAAARYYGKALRHRPGDVDLQVRLGAALGRGGETETAFERLEAAKDLDPESPAPHLAEAWVAQGAGDATRAQAAMEAALALAPDSPQVHLETGCLLAGEARWDEADAWLEEAIKLDRDLVAAYEWLGYVRECGGNGDDAGPAYRAGAGRGSQYCRRRLYALGQPAGGPSTSPGSQSAPPPAFVFGMMGFMVLFYGAMILFMLGMWVAVVLAVYDCARRDFDDPGTRAVWCLLIVLAQWIGAIIYYFLVYRKDDPPRQSRRARVAA